MKCSVINLPIALLLIHFKYGLSFPRIDIKDPTRLLYKYNDGAILEVSNTPEEPRTLKEIIYYHLIERPYPQGEEKEKIKADNTKESIDSVEAVHIDPRKDIPNKKNYSTEKPNNNGKRQKRDVYSEGIVTPETRPKRSTYRSWSPFSDGHSRTQTQHQRDQKAQNPRYSYQVGQPSRRYDDEDIEVDEGGDSNYDSDSSSESDISDDPLEFFKEPNNSAYLELEVSDEYSDYDGDSNSYEEEGEFNKDRKPGGASPSKESTTNKHNEHSGANTKGNGTSKDSHKSDVDGKKENLGSTEVDDLECDGEDCNESGEDLSSTFDNLVKEIHQIFVEENSTIDMPPGTIDNPESFNVLNLLDSILKERSKTNTQGIIIKTDSDQSNFLASLRGLFTNIIRNNVVVNNNVPVYPKPVDVIGEKDKPDENSYDVTETPVTKKPSKNSNTTTERPKDNITTSATTDKTDEKSTTSMGADQSKNSNATSPQLETTSAPIVSKNNTEANINKLNDDEPSHVNATTPMMEPESSSKGTEKPTTPAPSKVDINSTNEKVDGVGEVDKKIDYMLDLVNNDNFWKFMGDLGGKYLESLMAHTNSVIKEQVDAKIKEHTDALQKLEEKLAAQKEKEAPKEDRPSKEDSENKNKKGKSITENLSIKARNLFGNTVGNDKVTNVYVFYASEHIDEIIKNIQELANKTKTENSTNIFTFVPNEPGHNDTSDKPAEPIIKHTNNSDGHSKPTGEKNETTTSTNVTTEKPVSTTTSTEKSTDLTTSIVGLVPEKSPVTESTDKPTTKNDLPKETDHIDTTTVAATEKVTTIHSTEHSHTTTEAISNTTTEIIPVTTSSADDKTKATTESIKPAAEAVPSTTESTTTISEKLIEVTTEKVNGTTPVNDNEKSTVATELIAPLTESISSTTESDLKDTSTKTEEPNLTSTEASLTTLKADSNNEKVVATTENITITSEAPTEATTAGDQTDTKSSTVSENLSTTETPEQKTDNITSEATTEKPVDNTSSINNENNVTTEKVEAESAKTEVKEGETTEH